MPSIIVAAHNEAAVLAHCVKSIQGDGVEVIVVANGCSDDTAAIGRSLGVQVIELAEPSKAKALNAGDDAATAFPRFYIDADVELTPGAISTMVDAMRTTGALAAVPSRDLDLDRRPWPVRAYYAIHRRLPASQNGLYGRGVIAVSKQGRDRFDRFPEMTADDLFLDSLFTLDERIVVGSAASRIRTPTRTADLINRLSRVRAGNATMRTTGSHVRRSKPWSWLVDVVLPRPWLAPAGACYAWIVLAAQRRAARVGDNRWARDESSRAAA